MARIVKQGTTIIINATQKHTATVILSHGLGDTAEGWEDAAHEMSKKLPHIKWILPTAPSNPVTLNGGMRMPSWYDIESLSKSRGDQACTGIDDSTRTLYKFIDGEIESGIDASRIVLAGFSQGGAMSLWAGLQFPSRYKSRLAGVLVLSGYLPKEQAFKLSDHGRSTPVFHCHGTGDPVVLAQFADASRKHIVEAGHAATYNLKLYHGMAHTATMQELVDVMSWLEEVIPCKV
jgi:lysophospholipase-2